MLVSKKLWITDSLYLVRKFGELEQKLAQYTGSKHCVTVSSGTDSLLIALMALGVGAGDEVITVPYTWISTAEVIALLGAKPVFVDIRSDTWNMDETLLKLPLPIRPKQSCLYPFMDNVRIWMPLMRLQKSIIYRLSKMLPKVLVLLTKVKNPVIYQPSVALPFFHPNHSVVMETAGALFTNDDELAEKFRWIRVHGRFETT